MDTNRGTAQRVYYANCRACGAVIQAVGPYIQTGPYKVTTDPGSDRDSDDDIREEVRTKCPEVPSKGV